METLDPSGGRLRVRERETYSVGTTAVLLVFISYRAESMNCGHVLKKRPYASAGPIDLAKHCQVLIAVQSQTVSR